MMEQLDKKTLCLALYVAMGLMAATGIQQLVKAYYQANPQPEPLSQPTITVSGSGEAVAIPDVARMTIGVIEQGETVAEVTTATNTKMATITEALKSAGIAEADIKSTSYSLTPRYDYKKQPYEILGYSLNQSVKVTVRKIDDLGTIIDQVTAAGANSVGSPSFEVDDPTTVEAQARNEAFAEAKDKAQAMAKAAGVQLDEIVTFSETNDPVYPYNYDRGFGSLSEDSIAGEQAASFEPGSTELNVAVSVTYSLK